MAGNTGGNGSNDSYGTVIDNGYNLMEDAGTDCGFYMANNDIVGSDPQLGSLADNRGPTQTMALQAGSPALDAIPTTYDLPGTTTTLCSSKDQRGDTRPDDGEASCDIGAYEHSGPDKAPPPSPLCPVREPPAALGTSPPWCRRARHSARP